jgi:hypothetical protein
VVIDFGAMRYPLSQSASLRLARAAERSGAAVLALANARVCGTFAALTLSMSKYRASFARMSQDGCKDAPALFDGLRVEAVVERNKLGVFGDRAPLFAAVDPLSTEQHSCSSSLFPFPKGKGLGVRSTPENRFAEVPLETHAARAWRLGSLARDDRKENAEGVRSFVR